MPLKVLEATISTFNGVFDKFKSEAPKNKANFILFLADIDPATSQSWCPGNYLTLKFALLFLIVKRIRLVFDKVRILDIP